MNRASDLKGSYRSRKELTFLFRIKTNYKRSFSSTWLLPHLKAASSFATLAIPPNYLAYFLQSLFSFLFFLFLFFHLPLFLFSFLYFSSYQICWRQTIERPGLLISFPRYLFNSKGLGAPHFQRDVTHFHFLNLFLLGIWVEK